MKKPFLSLSIHRLPVLLLACLAVLAGCASPYAARRRAAIPADFRRPTVPAGANGNRASPARVDLGARLFAEPLLSRDHSMACATCHDPARDFQDSRPLPLRSSSPVAGEPAYRTPTLWNVGEQKRFFWDGRARSLEAQALMPIANPLEMNLGVEEAAARLREEPAYVEEFAAAFAGEPAANVVNPRNLGRALAAYQRTLVSPQAPFDRWVEGDAAALSLSAQRGFALFTGKAACISCHTGWNFSDGRRHDIGLPLSAAVRGETRLKTPTLRELTGRAPYFHDGSKATVEDVVAHYADGVQRRAGTPAPVALSSDERSDLVAFLRSLDSRTGEG